MRHDLAQIYRTHHHHVHGSQPLIAILSTIVQLQVEAGAMKRMNSNTVAKNFELRNLLAQNFYIQKSLWRFGIRMKCTRDVLHSCGLSEAAFVGWVMFAAPGQDIRKGFNPVVVQKHHSGGPALITVVQDENELAL